MEVISLPCHFTHSQAAAMVAGFTLYSVIREAICGLVVLTVLYVVPVMAM